MLVADAVYDDVLSDLVPAVEDIKVGGAFEPDVAVGSLISKEQVERVEGFLERASAGGAEIVTGGETLGTEGYHFKPTVVANPSQDSEIVQKEVFGPVVTVQRFSDEDQAIAWANGVEYGLSQLGVDPRRGPRDADGPAPAVRLRLGEHPHPADA